MDSLGDQNGDWTSVNVRMDNLGFTDPSLVACFPLDETTAMPAGNGAGFDRRQSVGDFSGNNHHAALTNLDGEFAWVPGKFDHLIQFAGVDSYATVSDGGVGNGASELTLSVWFRPQSKGDWKGMVTSVGTDYFGLILSGYGNGNPVEFRAMSIRATAPDYSGPVGEWTHAVGVWKSGAIMKLYLNGVEVANNPAPLSGTLNVSNWILGSERLNTDHYYDGTLDDVAMWTQAMSAAEVGILYIKGVNGYSDAPGVDPDGDGQTNQQEDQAGTNPVDGNSAFRAWIASMTRAQDVTLTLQWPGVYGRNYVVEWNPSLAANTWKVLPGVIPATTPISTTSVNAGFYRVKVAPPNP